MHEQRCCRRMLPMPIKSPDDSENNSSRGICRSTRDGGKMLVFSKWGISLRTTCWTSGYAHRSRAAELHSADTDAHFPICEE
jgi:hypothetical protein